MQCAVHIMFKCVMSDTTKFAQWFIAFRSFLFVSLCADCKRYANGEIFPAVKDKTPQTTWADLLPNMRQK